MPDHTDPNALLTALLEREVDCTRKLLSHLQQESAGLSGSSPDPIVEQNAEKLRLLETLQQATQARLDFMTAQNRNASANANKDASDLPGIADDAAAQLYDQLLELARLCFEENRRIGQLINRRTQFITRVLSSLAPSAPNPKAETYEENGNTSNSTRSGSAKLARI